MAQVRDRSWRIQQDKLNNGNGMGTKDQFKPEKKWKHMYLREEKLARARQLGFTYPRKSVRQILDVEVPVR